MPFIEVEDSQIAAPLKVGDDVLEAGDLAPGRGGSFKEKLSAAYRIENTLGSFTSRESNLPDSSVTNPNFNPWDYFTDEEKQDAKFIDSAILADNTEEIEAVRRQFERERSDRRILENGGMAAIMLSAVVDPINLIPVGGTAYKTYRSGGSILQGAMATSAVAAGTTAATEAGLLYSQLERTYGEASVNIGAATLFGGVLGATPQALKKIFSDSGVDFDSAIKEIEESFDPSRSLQEVKIQARLWVTVLLVLLRLWMILK